MELAAAAGALTVDGFQSSVVFEELHKRLAQFPELIKKVGGVYLFDLKSGDKRAKWTVDLKNGKGSIVKGEQGKADCTIMMNDAHFIDLMGGKMDGTEAYMVRVRVRERLGRICLDALKFALLLLCCFAAACCDVLAERQASPEGRHGAGDEAERSARVQVQAVNTNRNSPASLVAW